MSYLRDRKVWSWALYDWANSAFATTVMAGFFPLFFTSYYNSGFSANDANVRLAYSSQIASICIALISPFLGAMADLRGNKKHFLFFFTGLGIISTATLVIVGEGDWLSAALLFGVAMIGFSGAIVFYDALLPSVSRDASADKISSFAYGLGYLGGGLLFVFNVALYRDPQLLFLDSQTEAVKISFLSVALWWTLFSIPVFLCVPEKKKDLSQLAFSTLVFDSLFSLYQTIVKVIARREILLFLLAYWLYIDGVNTIIKLAIAFGSSLTDATGGAVISGEDLVVALLLTQFVAFPSAIAFGYLGAGIGAKRAISIGLFIYLLATIWASQIEATWEFYGLATCIGLVQGGVQALSRSFYSSLVPEEHAAEYFSFYNLVGKFATIIGPGVYALLIQLTGSARYGILGLVPLFLIGIVLLTFVKPTGERASS